MLTAVVMPEGHDADALRNLILEKYDLSLGTGLAKVAGKVFRIGHLGECNDLMLMAALSGVEMGLKAGGVPHTRGGVLRRPWTPCAPVSTIEVAGPLPLVGRRAAPIIPTTRDPTNNR